ncbi:hypothetical protein N657DRAFT_262890 [Parathielavia appendiculata]|uniref:Uncharacterized protein n=1 Tax=Parathielavia appendiculata TaxID=2587402 RepID=A0AAN6TR89_9PEZI|nr:hypothetical protein N657DRAFT_262890 [Parathielavia appendiculata]
MGSSPQQVVGPSRKVLRISCYSRTGLRITVIRVCHYNHAQGLQIILLIDCMYRASVDPDFEYILKHAKTMLSEMRSAGCLYQQLAALALAKAGVASNDGYNKARQLRYCQWMTEGRKDGTSPFIVTFESDRKSAAKASSKAFLSHDPASKKCGDKDANVSCSGCLIRRARAQHI